MEKSDPIERANTRFGEWVEAGGITRNIESLRYTLRQCELVDSDSGPVQEARDYVRKCIREFEEATERACSE